mgnify:CR=1 FL=1
MYYGSQRPSMARRAFKFAILTTFTFTLCFASSEKIMEGQIEPGEIQEVQSETIIMPAAFSAAGTPFRATFLLRQDPLLLDGPTGTGKTLIAKQVARELNIPIISRPATMFSTAGYKGNNLKELLPKKIYDFIKERGIYNV